MLVGCQQGASPLDVLEPREDAVQFRDPAECAECHPQHVADWEGSMHAYAVVDPVFHAMADFAAIGFEGEHGQFCTQCHTPPGFLAGETFFFETEGGWVEQRTENLSVVGGHGVSCDVCHSVTGILAAENGQLEYTPDGTARGPIDDPVANDYHASVGSALHRDGDLCTACHNVNVPPGVEFENTGLEWKAYIEGGGTETCQDCHMPAYMGTAATEGPERMVHAHTFVGVDIALVDDFPHRERQRELVEAMLRSAADLAATPWSDDTGAGFEVTITNLAGHALPSGATTERRMWLRAVVSDADGAVVWETGQLDANGDLMDGITGNSLDPTGDPPLWWFGSLALSSNDQPLEFSFFVEKLEERTIPPHRQAVRRFDLAALPPGTYTVAITLQYRAFQPHLLQMLADYPLVQLDEGLIERVPIFTMADADLVLTLP
jgi:hypothetical protein